MRTQPRPAWGAALPALAVGFACGSAPPDASQSHEAPPAPACSSEHPASCERACEAGDDAACQTLTTIALQSSDASGHARAAALSARLCESGRTRFCVDYAMALATGLGVPSDRDRARTLFEAHCGDDPEACSQYGNLFAAGLGVALDLGLAHLLLGEACDHDHAQACAELIPLVEHGCRSNHGPSCNELAVMRSRDGAAPRDVFDLFDRACAADDATGCRNLARAYAEGRGVPPDPARAAEVEARACRLDPSVCDDSAR